MKEKKEKKKKSLSLRLTELIMVKSGWGRTFLGEIARDKGPDGKTINRGKVVVKEGQIWSIGETEKELSDKLDGICTMKLERNLHNEPGIGSIIAGSKLFHN